MKHSKANLNKVPSILADSAYAGQPIAQSVRDVPGQKVAVQIVKRSELHTFQVMHQRWMGERSFAWLEKNRRLWKKCERWFNQNGF